MNLENETKSAFGPHFRKWLAMKRALRLVQEEVYTQQIYVPRIQYKVKCKENLEAIISSSSSSIGWTQSIKILVRFLIHLDSPHIHCSPR
jgi:hypothetical protein